MSLMLQFNHYIQVANGAPRPVTPKGVEPDAALVEAHKEWCSQVLNAGGQVIPCQDISKTYDIVPGNDIFYINYLEKNSINTRHRHPACLHAQSPACRTIIM